MKRTSRLLLPAALAVLIPATAQAAEQTPAEAGPSLDDRSYGDWLEQLADAAARRAEANHGSDDTMEAISDLAARWLAANTSGERTWDRPASSVGAVHKAVRNARRDRMRTERRHERIAAAAPTPQTIAPNQPWRVALRDLLGSVDKRDRDLLALTAQGLDAREIGERCGMSHAAVRQRIARARRKLR